MLGTRTRIAVAGIAALAIAMGRMTTVSAHALRSRAAPIEVVSGYYVGHNGNDLHLQMSSADRTTRYRGTLYTDGTFKDLVRDGEGRRERVSISNDGHTLRFRGTPPDDSEGSWVRVEGSDRVDLDLKRDGAAAPTDRIWIGSDNQHPASNGFTLKI